MENVRVVCFCNENTWNTNIKTIVGGQPVKYRTKILWNRTSKLAKKPMRIHLNIANKYILEEWYAVIDPICVDVGSNTYKLVLQIVSATAANEKSPYNDYRKNPPNRIHLQSVCNNYVLE